MPFKDFGLGVDVNYTRSAPPFVGTASVGAFLIQVSDDHLGPFIGELPGNLLANAACGARDDRNRP